jgi:hypothetical protein
MVLFRALNRLWPKSSSELSPIDHIDPGVGIDNTLLLRLEAEPVDGDVGESV